MKARLNIVTLGVSELARSRQFYLEALGWEATPVSDDSIVFYNQGGIVLALFPLENLAEDAGLSPERSEFSGVTLAINLESEKEVDQLFAQVIRKGGKELIAPRKTFWGGYDAYFADPDGHAWEIAHNPFAGFDEMGNLQV